VFPFAVHREDIASFPSRRDFLRTPLTLTAAITGLSILGEPPHSEDTDLFIAGPKKGYGPQIGTLKSQLAFMH